MKTLSLYVDRYKKPFCASMISVWIWGFFAHGYRFSASYISHDALNEFHGQLMGNQVKFTSGRILTSLYRDLIRGDITSSWLIGMLSLVWLGIVLFLIIQIFQIKSPLTTFLTAGILTANLAVSATAATYIHDLDCYMFCALCGAAAVFLWRFLPKWGWLPGSLMITVVLGIYQSYLFFAATLVVLVSILDIMQGKKAKPVFLMGLKAIGMVILGTLLYYCLLSLTGANSQPSNDYNSIDLLQQITLADIPVLIAEAYQYTLRQIWNVYSSYPSLLTKGATAVLGFGVIAVLVIFLSDKRFGISEKLLLLVLVIAMPLVMSAIYIISNGYMHDVMSYPVWLFYLFPLLLSGWLETGTDTGKWIFRFTLMQKWGTVLLVFFLLFSNVRFSNGMYVKKELEYEAYKSLMTRIMSQVEQTQGYEPGETEVVLIGLPKGGVLLNHVAPGFKDFWNVTGMTSPDVIAMEVRSRYQAYFDYVLGMPICLAEPDIWDSIVASELAQTMPAYPKKGFATFLNDTLLIKLG